MSNGEAAHVTSSRRLQSIGQWEWSGLIEPLASHLRRIYEELEVNTRTGAVAKALKEGLV